MSTARDRFHAKVGSSSKKSKFGELRMLLVILVLVGLAFVYAAPQFNITEAVSSAFSGNNQGIVLNYFYMSPKRAVEILGEPHSTTPYREDEELLYWKFEPVTLEIHFHNDQVARVAFATDDPLIRDHIEGRALKIYGHEDSWMLQRRNIDGELKIVHENQPAEMTVVKYEGSVMVYHYLFPGTHAIASD